jgi:hypothetical protein
MAAVLRARAVVAGRIRINQAVLLAVSVFVSAFALYVRTGAPSVLSGDQAEHQFTAWIWGVPHATGYPLFTMLNGLAVRLIPFGDVARRVNLMVALYSALAVLMAYLVTRCLTETLLPALVVAATIAFAPEFWQLATIAEVYTLQVFFIFATLGAVLRWWQVEVEEPDLGMTRRGLRHPLALASLLAGLGATHHGSFAPVVGPALLLTVAVPLLARLRFPAQRRPVVRLVGRALGWAALGFTPWLYLIVQFVLFRPFDYYHADVFPYHLYWGNPQSWGDVLNLALGAGFRLKVFTHGWGRLPELVPSYIAQLRHQVWWPGIVLGVFGAVTAWRRSWRLGLWTTLVWLGGSFFGLNVAADVPKAHVYYLPAWMMWALWIGLGVAALVQAITQAPLPRWIPRLVRGWSTTVITVIVLLLPIAIGLSRFERMDRSGDWHFRDDGRATMRYVEPDATILCRWEDCMTLRYVQFVESSRLGVQLDQTEPEAGVNWADRVPLYAPRPVYAIQFNEQLNQGYPLLPIESVPQLWKVLQ